MRCEKEEKIRENQLYMKPWKIPIFPGKYNQDVPWILFVCGSVFLHG